MNGNRRFLRGLNYVVLILATVILIYPVVYMVLASFTTQNRLLATIVLPIPNTLNWRVIVGTWNSGLWQAYVFTLGRCLFYIVLALYVGYFGGYIFSKLRFPGREKLFLLFLSGLVMPSILMLIPDYLMVAHLPFFGGNNWLGQGGRGLINDVRALFVFGWVPPFAVFIFKQNFDMLPSEYEDAAKIDGAGLFTIIFRVYGPLLRPVVATVIVITFLSIWNDYLFPSLVITDHPDFLPITIRIAGSGISAISSSASPPSPAAFLRILMALWPPAVVYLFFQKYFVQGLVAAGLKG